MPVYLFTYHTYGSWLPDRKRGYVVRKQGILPQDFDAAEQYRQRMLDTIVNLTAEQQLCAIQTALDSQAKQTYQLYAASTDATHVHLLLSWTDDRAAIPMRGFVKKSLSYALKKSFGKREWLSESGSRKRVRDRGHFDYLIADYLPKHYGWKWDAERGFFR